MTKTLLTETIGGRCVVIRQRMIDVSDIRSTWERQGPWMPGLKVAEIDGHAASVQELRALLVSAGREDLIQQLQVPWDT